MKHLRWLPLALLAACNSAPSQSWLACWTEAKEAGCLSETFAKREDALDFATLHAVSTPRTTTWSIICAYGAPTAPGFNSNLSLGLDIETEEERYMHDIISANSMAACPAVEKPNLLIRILEIL